METETQKFLKAEETASRLVTTLEQLHTEATSYRTATKELDAVRQRLVSLIEMTQNIASESHEAVKILRGIGGPEILKRLGQVEDRVSKESLSQSKRLNKLSILAGLTLVCALGAVIIGVIAFVR